VREGESLALLGIGTMTNRALETAVMLAEKGLNPLVADMRYLKPLDTGLLDDIATRCTHLVAIEENSVIGGFGSAVLDYLNRKHPGCRMLEIGLPDRFITHGDMECLYRETGLDTETLSGNILRFYQANP
jgi:1-deoxy-D-xylulose-5-phosphate synthase